MADCVSVILKALKEGAHHALLLQARLPDDVKAPKLGLLTKAGLLPVVLELQLAVPTTA